MARITATTRTGHRIPRKNGIAVLALTLVAIACDDRVVEPVPDPSSGHSPAMLRLLAADRDALVALYGATGGPDWKRNDNWLSDKPVDEWYGVATDSTGRVTGLWLIDNGLEGPLPAALGDLTELRLLQLPQNTLTGSIPLELGGLGRLDMLWLSDNELSGRLPDTLASLDSLRGLWVGDNELEGVVPNAFRDLRILVFDIAGNEELCVPATAEFVEWTEGIPFFGGRWCSDADAEVLRILFETTGGENWNSAEGWLEGVDLGAWRGVETDSVGRVSGLDLSGNALRGRIPEQLGALANLARLNVASNDLWGPLPQSLTGLSLEEFKYADTRLCVPDDAEFRAWLNSIARHEGTGAECSPLTEREVLEAFYNATGGDNWNNNGNWLTDAPLGEWYGVSTNADGKVDGLRLRYNLLVGKIPPEFGQLAHLRSLDFVGNYYLNGPLPVEFFDLPELRFLDLSLISLGALQPEIARLTKLEHLEIVAATVIGLLPPELGELSELRHLRISFSYVFGEIPPELGNLTNLTYLDLAASALTGPIPAELGNLSSLTKLNLASNDLTGEIPAELGNLDSLQHLLLDYNELSGSIPHELGNLANLGALHLEHNELSGSIPTSLQGLRRLKIVQLQNNALEGPLPDSIGQLSNLTTLWVGNNAGLSGPVPTGMTALQHLASFKAGGSGLCAPQDAGFLEWLDGVRVHRLARCEKAAAHLTQAVQSREFPVALVPGRPALLRVFLASEHADGETLPKVRATFYADEAEVHVTEIAAGTGTIPKEVDEGSLASSANVEIPGAVVRPGLEMVIEVDPDSMLDPRLGIPGRIPATGRMSVDVADLGDLQLTLVPFLYESDPDSSILETTAGMAGNPDEHPMLADTRTLLPVSGWDIELHDPVVSSSNHGVVIMLETEAIRLMEGRPGYWLSMLAPVPQFGILGVALTIPSWTSFSVPLPATVAHELGHNMGLWHAPCGGAVEPDPLYPHSWGTIGSWGYDRENHSLVTPYAPDIMTYCGGPWISDYHRSNVIRHRMHTEPAAEFGTKTRSVLVWGGQDAEGVPFLEPSFIVEALPSLPPPGRDFVVKGRTDVGNEAFSISFDMPKTPDAEGESAGFVFAVPVTWEGELRSITLAGIDESVLLDEDSDQPMTILRDPVTGQVRAILRRSVEQAMATVGEPGLEALFSRGIPR